MIEELVKSGKLYGYATDFNSGGKGIVIADSEEDAKNKVVDAYLKHGYSESELTEVAVWKVTTDENNFFDDSCDVLEVWE